MLKSRYFPMEHFARLKEGQDLEPYICCEIHREYLLLMQGVVIVVNPQIVSLAPPVRCPVCGTVYASGTVIACRPFTAGERIYETVHPEFFDIDEKPITDSSYSPPQPWLSGEPSPAQ